MNNLIHLTVKGVEEASRLAAKGFTSLIVGSAVVTATIIIPAGIAGAKSALHSCTQKNA